MTSRSRKDYHVGVICTLPKEILAARSMLDEEHEVLRSEDTQDSNNYVLGRVHQHCVVIACLPSGLYGTTSAAVVANNMLRTFPRIRFGLMVGIGGGIPGSRDEDSIRLGDVVVSQPQGVHGGVVRYDLGRNLGPGKFERKGTLKQPPTVLLTALSSIQARPGTSHRQLAKYTSVLTDKVAQEDEGYGFPGVDQDYLFCARCDWSESPSWWWIVFILLFWLRLLWLCQVCEGGEIKRPLDRTAVKLFYGTSRLQNQYRVRAI